MTTMQSPQVQRLDIVTRRLLDPAETDVATIGRMLGDLAGSASDFADLYFERGTTETWRLRDGLVTNGTYAATQGVGARAMHGERAAFAYSSDISRRGLQALIDTTATMRGHGNERISRDVRTFRASGAESQFYPAIDPAAGTDVASRIAMLRRIDDAARAVDPRVTGVTARLTLEESIVLVAATDGTLAADVRPSVHIALTVVAEANGIRTMGNAGSGGRFALDGLDDGRLEVLIDRATRTALTGLDARAAPSGPMTVVLGPGFPGVLLHEAVGHGLEGDAHRKRSSVFVDRIGEMIAAPGVTVIDDGTMAGRFGSLNMDDEGVPGERTVLIDDGRLAGLMQDRTNARLMNQRSTGNARRQSYAHLPMPRMTNTYLAPGAYDPAEIIASVKRGIYADEFGGGTVDTTSGQFNFGTTRAWLIEDGRITAPIRGATLIGVGHQALKHIRMVGNDLALDQGEAMCGKDGQSVRVSVGQPTIRIDEMVVGGAGE